MERIFQQLSESLSLKKTSGILLFISLVNILPAQNKGSVKGTILDAKNMQPIPFATVIFSEIPRDTTPPEGTISNNDGSFNLKMPQGEYQLQVTSVGYKLATKNIHVAGGEVLDAGKFLLLDSTIVLNEATAIAERIRGKSENNKTVFFLNKKILGATGSAPDILRHIPGVQVDLKKNISLEGSSNILLYVDGRERDKNYISQLDPLQIDKIEVINTPPSGYDGDVTGVINIILKKEKKMGFSGQVFTEVPSSKELVYSFPSYNLSYGAGKLNLFTSYNGEINYENIDEVTFWTTGADLSETKVTSIQHVRQRNLSHRFHYGFDYYLSKNDVVNFYGFYNPFSYEQDGEANIRFQGSTLPEWSSQRSEDDKNSSFFNSLYYNHRFHNTGAEVSIDISYARLRTNNTILYTSKIDSNSYSNTQNPGQNTGTLKIDLTTPFGEKLKLSTGIKARLQAMFDKTSTGFDYRDEVYALYGAFDYSHTNYNVQAGVRAEKAFLKPENYSASKELTFLPYASFNYKINPEQNLRISYRHSVKRPSVYNLNPFSYREDPFTLRKGNPLLKPEYRTDFYAEHSIRFGSNYLATRIFFGNSTQTIGNLTTLSPSNTFTIQEQNLGNMCSYGIQFSGALKSGSFSFNPYIRFYNLATKENNLAAMYGIKNRNSVVLESGLSSIWALKHDFALSMTFQYTTPKIDLQGRTFSDALYFISLDKTFKKKFKAGIVSALPFVKNFIYQGAEVSAPDFSRRYTGNLKLPDAFLMFRFSYRFSTGEKRNRIDREKVDIATRPKSGFSKN